MTEQASTQGSTSSRWHVQRPLSEPVLESVERELGAQAAQGSQEAHKVHEPQGTPARAEQPRPHTGSHTGNGIDHKGWQSWADLRDQLAHRVTEQPGRAALVAVGAGALTALLLNRILGRKRGQS
ncbi:MAG: hypothetical protein WCK08_20685 [Betaproteobacteria bacterium]